MSLLDDPSALRAADNIARRCLAVSEGEVVGVLGWSAPELVELLRRSLERAGAKPRAAHTEAASFTRPEADRFVLDALGDATASVLVAAAGLPPPLSMAAVDVATHKKLRHLHLTRADPRLFSQSYAAEPDLLQQINQRLESWLGGRTDLTVTSDAGTDLHVTLAPRFPFVTATGRPPPGKPENLPSGTLAFHPASVEGVLVADRGGVGAIRFAAKDARQHPPRFHFGAGKLTRVEATDEVSADVSRYQSLHAMASRVGLVSLPTNYIVRAESGIDVQDALLPGLCVSLGYSFEEHSKAPFACPVQLRLFGRRQTVRVGARELVRAGRLADELVAGIDPFR